MVAHFVRVDRLDRTGGGGAVADESAVKAGNVLAADRPGLAVQPDHLQTALDQGLADAGQFRRPGPDDPLVLDKWFSVQAFSMRADTAAQVERLAAHRDFTLTNPNRVRSLVGAFAANQPRFHASDGAGYAFLADTIIALNAINPQVAAKQVPALGRWRRFDAGRQALMKAQLERILSTPGISKDVFEQASKSLG